MKITVIGLGLIGGSMALDLKGRGFCSRVVGVDNNPEHCRQALERGIADEIRPLEESTDAELLILSVPVTQIAKLLPGILDKIGDNTVVMDVGSIKEKINNAIRKHPRRKQFVGTHPIAGTENSGPSAAVSGLFDNKTCILCVDDSALWVVERVTELYESLNMKPLFMQADEHDKQMAYTSHLLHISSFALASTVLEMEKNTSTAIDLAGSDFGSIARLAKSSPDMWTPVFKENSKYVSKALGTYIKHLTKFKTNLDKGNAKGMHASVSKANGIRKILK